MRPRTIFDKKLYNRNKAKEYRESNPEKYKENNARYREKNVEQRLISAAKWRAKQKGITCDIEVADIKLPIFCPYTGIKIVYGTGKGRNRENPSLDKVLPERGYIKGNIEVISDLANRMKSDASIAELQLFASEILRRWPLV